MVLAFFNNALKIVLNDHLCTITIIKQDTFNDAKEWKVIAGALRTR